MADTKYDMIVGSKTYTLNTTSVQFRGNTYNHLSLGVSQAEVPMNKMPRGSLHSLNHVFMADFSSETYTNVGAFTLEHLNYTIIKIKGENTTL